MGEFGLSNHCDSASACQWLEYSLTRLKANHIPWFYWDWQWDFSMFRSHVISEDSIYPCFKYYMGLYGDDSFTEVQEPQPQTSFGVYPNPVSDLLTMDYPGSGTLTVCDVSGRMVVQMPYRQSTSLHVSHWDKGIYLLRMANATEVHTARVVVSR
jgi:hypothetical protein